LNGKELLYHFVDGDDERSPTEVAKELNMLGSTSDLEISSVIEEVLKENSKTIDKMKQTGKDGPVMFLVG
jgi:Asp-tRNA(Asn)/Glu-tRNA(Gln) amidotransferase B subunit